MASLLNPGIDRIRSNTADEVNEHIDRRTRDNILWFSREDPITIQERINELDKEWDMERVLILNAALFSLTGLLAGKFKNKIWSILPIVVSSFLIQHAIQGWCPPVELFRRMGIRTRKEIDMEKYSLIEALKTKQK